MAEVRETLITKRSPPVPSGMIFKNDLLRLLLTTFHLRPKQRSPTMSKVSRAIQSVMFLDTLHSESDGFEPSSDLALTS